METKKGIRTYISKKRLALSEKDRLSKSEIITGRVLLHPWFLWAETVYAYVDCNGEVETRLLIDTALDMGKRVAVPRVSGQSMDFYFIGSLKELKLGTFGVMEPVTDEKADGRDGLVIMPGLAFDEKLNRIGYGKGYYDRYLSAHPELRTMALAFELQRVKQLPFEEHDIRPELLVTETNSIYPQT